MANAVIMPKAGITVESCIIGEWLKNVGDQVSVGDILFTYETDKASFECESTAEGELLEIFYGPGDEVPCLINVCAIGTKGEDVSALKGAGAAPAEEAPAAASNVYHGVGECGFGVVEVDVTMDGDKIASIVVTKNTTDFAPADSVITSIISGNGVDGVDTKTGATATANALVAAVQDALSKVQK